MALQKKPLTKEKALERLTSLCSRSEQCEYDLNTKLIRWGIPSDQRNEIISYLKENRYLDNARFARSFANDKARFSSWGPVKIRMELVKRRVTPLMIKDALERVPTEVWKEALKKSAVAKSRHLNLTGEDGVENRQKLYNYLIGRGFTSSMSSKAVALMKRKQEESLNE